MPYRNEESDIMVVQLSQKEGQQLFALLEHSIAQADQRLDLAALVSMLDSLSDANALARWKRENVAFELRPDEAVAALQALELGRECCKRCSAALADLGGVRAKLTRYVANQCTTAGETRMPPGLTQPGSSSVPEPLVTAK
jgi:hypothetical protein